MQMRSRGISRGPSKESSKDDTEVLLPNSEGVAPHKLRGCCRQLGQLRRLAQPYFLPLEGTTGWHFLWLLLCLNFCIAGITLLLLTSIVKAMMGVAPQHASDLLGGSDKFVQAMWEHHWAYAVLAASGIGVGSFIYLRRHFKERRWVPWILLGMIVLVLLMVNGLNTGIGFIARLLTNALIHKKEDEYEKSLMTYVMVFVIALPILTGQYFFQAKLGLLWRKWLCQNLIEGWMSHRTYYSLNPNDETSVDVDNPDQRISEDTRNFTKQSLVFLVGVLDSFLTFVLNILVLLSINVTLTGALMTWALLNTILLIVASRNLVNVNYTQLRYEADFRYGLVHIRDNAESIAFYSGEDPEKQESQHRLDEVVKNYNRLINWEVMISVLRRIYNYGSIFIPYLILAPSYLAGDQDYGSFVQATFAFQMVEGALSFIASNIDGLAAWSAGITRLDGFQQKITEAMSLKPKINENLNGNSEAITVCQAELRTPNTDQVIVHDLSFNVGVGDRVLVVGPSGCGKTSVLRMISGLWEPASGSVETPPVGKLLFVPQKPYMLLGSLREQLCYPHDKKDFKDIDLRDVLVKVNLAHFLERYPNMDVKQDWARILSVGEQQRLAFARLLLNWPQFAVLDEATSALDVNTERRLYELLIQRGIAFISVGHRPTLKEFHTNVLELQGQGAWRLVPAASYDFAATATATACADSTLVQMDPL